MKALAQSYMSFSFVRSSQSSAWHEWLHLQYLFCKKAAISKSSINLWLKGFFLFTTSTYDLTPFSPAAPRSLVAMSVSLLLLWNLGPFLWLLCCLGKGAIVDGFLPITFFFSFALSGLDVSLQMFVCVREPSWFLDQRLPLSVSTPEKSAPFLGSIFMIIV